MRGSIGAARTGWVKDVPQESLAGELRHRRAHVDDRAARTGRVETGAGRGGGSGPRGQRAGRLRRSQHGAARARRRDHACAARRRRGLRELARGPACRPQAVRRLRVRPLGRPAGRAHDQAGGPAQQDQARVHHLPGEPFLRSLLRNLPRRGRPVQPACEPGARLQAADRQHRRHGRFRLALRDPADREGRERCHRAALPRRHRQHRPLRDRHRQLDGRERGDAAGGERPLRARRGRSHHQRGRPDRVDLDRSPRHHPADARAEADG